MGTATQKPVQHHDHHPASTTPQAIDPEHDIDAKSTILWLSGALVFVVVALLCLSQVFSYSLQGHMRLKIDGTPTTELNQQHEQERAALQRPNGKSLDDTLRNYAAK